MPARGIAQCSNQCAVTAHRMPKNPTTLNADREVLFYQRGQLLVDVAAHAIVRRPGRGRGVEIEAGADAKVPGLGIPRQIEPAGTGVAGHERQAIFGRQPPAPPGRWARGGLVPRATSARPYSDASRRAPALIMNVSSVQVRPAR